MSFLVLRWRASPFLLFSELAHLLFKLAVGVKIERGDNKRKDRTYKTY
jgi:hypothetical protein